MKNIWKTVVVALLVIVILSGNTFGLAEHWKKEMVYPGGPTVASADSATGVLDEIQQSGDYQRGYQEGYQAGYYRGLMDAYQWMITKIQEQMAGTPLEGPKIKQAVDALTPQVGDLK